MLANKSWSTTPSRDASRPAGAPLALEALVVDEALDSFEDRLQPLGQGEIVVEPIFLRIDFENDGEHWLLLAPPRIDGNRDRPLPIAVQCAAKSRRDVSSNAETPRAEANPDLVAARPVPNFAVPPSIANSLPCYR